MNVDFLDRYLPPEMRAEIETRYYARVNQAALIENTRHDPGLWANQDHVTWFSDHGVVHVRDVASQVLKVLDAANGALIPAREGRRLDLFMKTYGVLLAYLHDIGMMDFSASGRAIHPQFAAHAVFDGSLDAWVEQAWDENLGNIAWRLVGLERRGALAQPPQLVFRETLSMSMAHSKSKVPVAVLNDRHCLRELMVRTLTTSLKTLYEENRSAPTTLRSGSARGPYPAAAEAAFAWLVSDEPTVRELTDDVIDTVRALRCADALRQRGTVQKTSGGYEVFVSLDSGNSVFAVRHGDSRLYLIEHQVTISAGEGNLAGSEITSEGDVRISFNRGGFATEEALQQAVRDAVITVDGIQEDVLSTFSRTDDACGGDPAQRMSLLLESVEDNPAFVDLVVEAMVKMRPHLEGRVRRAPSLGSASSTERTRYLAGSPLAWDTERKEWLLSRMAECGQRVEAMDLSSAFDHTRVSTVATGERLIVGGTPSGFVYVPLDTGLEVVPLGGYSPFPVKPFMPLGATGVIRNGVRNGDVTARRPVEVLIIPKEVYLQEWYRPWQLADVRERLMEP